MNKATVAAADLKAAINAPRSLVAEQALLGAIMMEDGIILDVMKVIHPHHFYRTMHREIYLNVAKLKKNRGLEVDLIVLVHELMKQNLLEGVGGAAYLTALVEACPSSTNWRAYADIVLEEAQRRAMLCLAEDLRALMVANTCDSSDYLATLSQGVQRIETMGQAKPPPDYNRILEGVLKEKYDRN